MADVKRITGIAMRSDYQLCTVALTEREKSSEIIDDIDMKIMLEMACNKQGLALISVKEISYVY